jgi:diaminopimelate decarboxylase
MMSCLHYRESQLYIEKVSLAAIAKQFGTPAYVYSRAAIEHNWRDFDQAFQALNHQICYAVKANSNLSILNLFARLHSGFDIVSLGELERVLAAGGDPKKVVFSGVAKSEYEIEEALKKHIYCFNVESEAELQRIAAIASSLKMIAPIALRINPNVDAGTHTYISTGLKENKFGIDFNDIIPLCQQLSHLKSLRLIGIACHIGSQITDLGPFQATLPRLLEIYQQLLSMNISIEHINIGGGLGIIYHKEQPPAISDYAKMVKEQFSCYPLKLLLEPGRSLVGNTGILLTRVEYLKCTQHKNFAIVDAGMNDLLRPALYHAWQNILAAQIWPAAEKKRYDIAGPVCESADFLGKERELAIRTGDLLAVDAAGAYGFSMSSNYNSRCRPAEIMVDGNKMRIIRRRETIQELFAAENIM